MRSLSAPCPRGYRLAMRRPVLLAAVLSLSAAFPTAAPAHARIPGPVTADHAGVPLRVATYNIAAGRGADGAFDLERTAAALRALRADVVGLQEVDVRWGARSEWRDEAAELAGALGMDVYFAPVYTLDPPGPGAPPRRFGVAVLSRHPITHAENHEITRLSTQDPNPGPAPAPGFPEAVVDVRGTLVHIYATHLDYRSDPAVRKLQVADTRRIMAGDCTGRGPGGPAAPGRAGSPGPAADGRAGGAGAGRAGSLRCPPQVLLGDFNAPPGAPELAPLWAEADSGPPAPGPGARTAPPWPGLRDAWTAVGGTDPGFTYPAASPGSRIDYVAVSPGVNVTGAVVGGTLASDHRPVVADLTVRGHRTARPATGPRAPAR